MQIPIGYFLLSFRFESFMIHRVRCRLRRLQSGLFLHGSCRSSSKKGVFAHLQIWLRAFFPDAGNVSDERVFSCHGPEGLLKKDPPTYEFQTFLHFDPMFFETFFVLFLCNGHMEKYEGICSVGTEG